MSEAVPINQKQLRRFFYQIGFTCAMEWTEEKLRNMAMMAGKQLNEEDVPKAHRELFTTLKTYTKSGKYINWAPVMRKKPNET